LVAAKERDASCKDLDHEDGHIERDIHLVVEDAMAVRGVGHIHYFLGDGGNGTYEDMVAADMMDGCCSKLIVLAILQRKGSVGDGQRLLEHEEDLDEVQDQVHGLDVQRLQTSQREMDEDLCADSTIDFLGERPPILLSKSLQQQSRRRVRNYQSCGAVVLVVLKLILQ
jgi:hypothetical protein